MTIKMITRYECECGLEFRTEQKAIDCESSEGHKTRLETLEYAKNIRKERQAEVKKWEDQGHSIWYEDGMQHAPKVDSDKFGSHDYPNHDGTSDCGYGCGCWMGPSRSGGKVDPFGACPNNPKPNDDKIKILDVILHRNKDYTQTFVVLSRKPEYLYEVKKLNRCKSPKKFLVGEDGGCFNFLYYYQDRHAKAFAGREFKFKMKIMFSENFIY